MTSPVKKTKLTARQKKHQRYDAVLEHLDGFLAPLLELLSSPEFSKDTIVVITSDHGEGLGDHGYKNHSSSLFNAQTRVPLILVGPGVDPQRIKKDAIVKEKAR